MPLCGLFKLIEDIFLQKLVLDLKLMNVLLQATHFFVSFIERALDALDDMINLAEPFIGVFG